MDNRYGLFPYYYNFKKKPIVIIELSELEPILQNLDIFECYYFYQGYYSDILDGPDIRIYDTPSLISIMNKHNFKRIFSYKIDDIDVLLYKRN